LLMAELLLLRRECSPVGYGEISLNSRGLFGV